MADERVTLEGQDAIDLWKKGKKAWNAWVEANPVADVSFEGVNFSKLARKVSFASFDFPEGDVTFSDTTFGSGTVDFSDASFRTGQIDFNNATVWDGDVDFKGTTFGNGDIYFIGTKFGNGRVSLREVNFGAGNVAFNQAAFKGSLSIPDPKNSTLIKSMSFKGCVFESTLTLEGEFNCVPDLRGTITKAHVDLQGLRVTPDFKGHPEKTAASLRRLKELAEANRHHDAALRYHADEKRALRPTLPWPSLSLDWAFDMVSNYGQSIGRPALGLAGVFVGFLAVYAGSSLAATKGEITASIVLSRLSEAFSFSLTNILPFVASARAVRVDASEALFGLNPGFWIDLASMTQGGLGFVLLFLIGLGLRNRFRI